MFDSGEVLEVQTDAAGRFTFTHIPFGDYILEARAQAGALQRASVRLNARDLTRDLTMDTGS